MIRKILFTVLPVVLCATLLAETMSSTGIAGRTGAPGETNCSACHSGQPLNAAGGSVTLDNPTMPGNVYTPGQTYNMSVTVARTGIGRFGFGVVALTSSNQNGGTLNITDPASTQIKSATVSGVSRRNVVHTAGGGNGTGSKTFSFSWTAPAIGTGNVTFYFAGNAVNANGATTGDYVYTGSVVLTEAPCNTPATPSSITGNTSYCLGTTGVLSVVPDPAATSYTWSLPGGWSGSSTTNTISVIAGANTGTITVTANNACGNSPAQSVSVTSYNLTASVSTSNNSCAGASSGTAQINPSGGASPYSYQWSPGVSTTSSASGLFSGSYSVTVTDGNGCTALQSFSITEPSAIVVQAGASQNACEGSVVTLGGTPIASGGVPPYTYLWNDGSGLTYTSASPTITVNNSTTWNLTVTDANGCVSSGSTTVIEDPLPAQPVILFVNDSLVTSSSGLLQWYLNGALLSGSSVSSIMPSVNGDYTVSVTDPATGCSSTSDPFNYISTGIGSVLSADMFVYPNPASDRFLITTAIGNQPVTYRVFDFTGALVISGSFSTPTETVDISALPAGIYTVCIKNGSNLGQERLMIVR